MFGIGMPEMILIMAVALIVIGPKKLPELAKSLGKALGEFRKATRELKDSIAIDDEIDDAKKTFQDFKYDLDAVDINGEKTEGVDEPALTQHHTSDSEREEQPKQEQESKTGETKGSLEDV